MTMQAAVQFSPAEIPNFKTFNTQIQEHVLIIPCYIAQMALAQKRINEIWEKPIRDAAIAFVDARTGEQFLFNWLKLGVRELVWKILLEHPNQQEIHPAITVVRDAGLHPIDIIIAEDLSPWLPPSVKANGC